MTREEKTREARRLLLLLAREGRERAEYVASPVQRAEMRGVAYGYRRAARLIKERLMFPFSGAEV